MVSAVCVFIFLFLWTCLCQPAIVSLRPLLLKAKSEVQRRVDSARYTLIAYSSAMRSSYFTAYISSFHFFYMNVVNMSVSENLNGPI